MIVKEMPLSLGQKIREVRMAEGLTQGTLAKRAEVSESMIAQVEMGKKVPHLHTLERIAKALGSTAGGLLTKATPEGHYLDFAAWLCAMKVTKAELAQLKNMIKSLKRGRHYAS